ncbi:hypothetical protein QFZ76_003966 [Streptomyces sp. V4I2]|nr:hypothetical protein [Streptomyces sp. V4I2]MDQ1045730.1 hypothetical protein [Streptomyces sp. V4I2]
MSVQTEPPEPVPDDEPDHFGAEPAVAAARAHERAEVAASGVGIPFVEDDLADEFAGGPVGDGEVEPLGVIGAGGVDG